MVIGIDASRAFNKNRTGTENYSFQVLKNLIEVDHNNNYYIYNRPTHQLSVLGSQLSDLSQSVISPSVSLRTSPSVNKTDKQETGQPDSENRKQKTDNIRNMLIPFPYLWTQAGLALQTFKDPLDVLFIPSHTLPLIRKPGLKTVVTVHDLGAEYLPKTHQLKQRLYLNFMTHYQLKSATHLIAVSEATKKDLIKLVGIPEEKITVIYEGYDKDLFKPVTDDTLINTLKHYELPTMNYLLFVGTIQPRKNLERLIRAYAKFMDSLEMEGERWEHLTSHLKTSKIPTPPPLVLAGGKGWLSDEIYQLPKKLGIEDKVKFLGFVPDKDLPALYQGAIALLFPSLFEGFGLPILEAMAVGCPVLTSNVSSMKEISQPSALLVNPYSIDSIFQGITQLTMNHQLRTTLTKKGLEHVKQFSWEKCAKETLKVLTNLASYQPKP